MNSSNKQEIHEFSTGIHFEQQGNSWIWTGFTIKYMNSTMGEEIPKVVERSIANEEFALAEGSSTEKPAIIARILGSGNDIWSVIAVVTRGRDEVGRSAAFHRYFLCRGDHKLRVILAWWEQNNRPTFNPLDQQDEGSPHIFEGKIPQPPDLEQILPLFKVQTKPEEEQRLSSPAQQSEFTQELSQPSHVQTEPHGEQRLSSRDQQPVSTWGSQQSSEPQVGGHQSTQRVQPLSFEIGKPSGQQRLSSPAQQSEFTQELSQPSDVQTELQGQQRFPSPAQQPVSTWGYQQPSEPQVEEYSLFQQLSPIVLEPNVQYDLYTINVLAINKWNSCKNGLPVCWAFDVEALVKPERFQVIKPASQKARDGINRAIAAGSRVVRNAVNIDEAALKSALRSLANSSQVKPESVETIVNGLNNKDVTREYWHSLFNAQGIDRAIKEKIYSPQIVRLMTLRALVIPETLPEFLQWLNIQKGSNVDGNQRVSLELQKKIQPLFPKEQIAAGITYLLPSLLGGKISVDGLCWLLAKSGGDTIWAYGRNQFINNIKYDLQLIYNYYSKPIVGLFDESTLKCKAEVWRSLINRWQGIRGGYKKCEKYLPLAQLFEQFKEYDLAGYFYQVSDGVVKKDLFDEIPKAQNRPSPVIYGLGIEREVTLEDILIDLVNSIVNFFNQDVDMKLVFVIPVSLLILGSGWFIGSKTWQYVYANEAEKFLCEKSGGGENCPVIVLNGKTHYSFNEIKQVIPKVVKQVVEQQKKILTPEPTQSPGLNRSGQNYGQQDIKEKVIENLIQILGDKNLKYQDLNSTDKIEEAVKTQWVIAVYNYQLKSKIEQKISTQKSGKEECVLQIFGFCLQKNIKTEETYILEAKLTNDINEKIKPRS
ncbi:hypothetical protein [Cylindrospermopsis curvispora]|uniref:Uncharacterized protein n=1 Tax=Cylindrospermopsis curvispora GIHE-G1 TaxID=2666332 RepID=A0A7H0F4C4_9CYAN|nr:hypothetical protein [Cylindrospermopsis curvispora]QNP30890.1 hypothetical protein IAR63_07890 [Cylindrospermopsis curvispora GIHE-G1]